MRSTFAALVFVHALANGPALGQTAIEKSIVTDFGARCDGIANDSVAFLKFNRWAVVNQGTSKVTLHIPPGRTCCFLQPGQATAFASGIKDLLVIGYGATISDCGRGSGFFLGAVPGLHYDNMHSARLATVSAGSASVALQTPAQARLFKPGSWALITGVDPQGFGDPPNPAFFEYVQIAGIEAGTITFTAPLRHTYKSTWPAYNRGDAFHSDLGGPATLYVLAPAWNARFEYRGLTISQRGQTYANGREVTYRDVTFTGSACGIPTQNMVWQALNVTMTDCIMEVDKLIDRFVFASSTIKRIIVQSSSIKDMVITNSTVTDYIVGSAVTASAVGSSIPYWRLGAIAYGASRSVTITDSTAPKIQNDGGATEQAIDASFSMKDGVMRRPLKAGPARWAIPGADCYFRDRTSTRHPFKIVDISTDGTDTLITTNLTGGFPAAGPLSVGVSPVALTVNFLLRRDLDPISRENRPVWLHDMA